MNRKIVLICAFLGAFFHASVWADSGTELPCEDCPEFHELMQYPSSGIWFDPDQPGTGFLLEVQNGVMVGYYFLYTEDGEPEWLMFNGPLEAVSDEGARWVLETGLMRVSGGSCLNCPYQPVEQIESAGQVRLEFGWRNHGRFSVDDAPMQAIVSFAFAVPMMGLFQPDLEYRLPSLGGVSGVSPPFSPLPPKSRWVFVFSAREGLGYRYGMLPVEQVGGWSVDEDGYHSVHLGALIQGELAFVWGKLRCRIGENDGPLCRIDFDLAETSSQIADSFVSQTFYLAPGNWGHNRIEAESANGNVTLVGYRQDYD